MADSQDNGNGRITLAEIKKDIAYLTRTVDQFCSLTSHQIEELERKAVENRNDIIRLEERQRQSTGWLAGMQAVGAAIAAALGRIGQ